MSVRVQNILLMHLTPLSNSSAMRHQRSLLLLAVVFTVLYLSGQLSVSSSRSTTWSGWPGQKIPTSTNPQRRASWGALRQQGAKATIKENLRPDKKYLTTFPGLGWNNQVFDIFNMIYLAYNSGRIPILPPFWPHYAHYYEDGLDASFGDVFDLPRLRAALDDLPLVELFELKASTGVPERWRRIRHDGESRQIRADGTEYAMGDWIEPFTGNEETLGCWSWWQNMGAETETELNSMRMNISLELTPFPPNLYHEGRQSWKGDLVRTAEFLKQSHSTIPVESLETLEMYQFPAPQMKPDEHLACIDSSYWYIEQPTRFDLHEEWRRGLGVWATVAQYARWKPEVEDFAMRVGKRMLGVRDDEQMPPYIAIHIRRGDFGPEWMELTQLHYAYIAHQVLSSIYHDMGIRIKHILVTTDEKDEGWLAPLRQWGFTIADHKKVNMYDATDDWLPLVIDSILLGNGKGFLGPRSSTMSILSYLRCKDWNAGVSRWMQVAQVSKVPAGWTWSWDPAP